MGQECRRENKIATGQKKETDKMVEYVVVARSLQETLQAKNDD